MSILYRIWPNIVEKRQYNDVLVESNRAHVVPKTRVMVLKKRHNWDAVHSQFNQPRTTMSVPIFALEHFLISNGASCTADISRLVTEFMQNEIEIRENFDIERRVDPADAYKAKLAKKDVYENYAESFNAVATNSVMACAFGDKCSTKVGIDIQNFMGYIYSKKEFENFKRLMGGRYVCKSHLHEMLDTERPFMSVNRPNGRPEKRGGSADPNYESFLKIELSALRLELVKAFGPFLTIDERCTVVISQGQAAERICDKPRLEEKDAILCQHHSTESSKKAKAENGETVDKKPTRRGKRVNKKGNSAVEPETAKQRKAAPKTTESGFDSESESESAKNIKSDFADPTLNSTNNSPVTAGKQDNTDDSGMNEEDMKFESGAESDQGAESDPGL